MESSYFCYLGTHVKFLSGRKERASEEEERRKKRNNDKYYVALAHALRLDQKMILGDGLMNILLEGVYEEK